MVTASHALPLALLGATAALAWAPRPAEACSAPACSPGRFHLPAAGDPVPASLPAVLFEPSSDSESNHAEGVELVRIDGTAKKAIALSATRLATGAYLLTPEVPLEEGAIYRLTDQEACWDEPAAEATFETGPALPLPSALGAVTVTAPTSRGVSVASHDPYCPTDVEAMVADVTLAPDKSMLPWLRLVDLEVVVDGRRWYGDRPWVSETRLFTICSDNQEVLGTPGLAEGLHEVSMRALLGNPEPGGEPIVLETPPVEVVLECDPEEGDPESGGCTVGAGGGLGASLLLCLLAWQRPRRRR